MGARGTDVLSISVTVAFGSLARTLPDIAATQGWCERGLAPLPCCDGKGVYPQLQSLGVLPCFDLRVPTEKPSPISTSD